MDNLAQKKNLGYNKKTMKKYTLISWNVNGVRAAIKKNALSPLLEKYSPDFLCLQEVKAEESDTDFLPNGYTRYWNSAEKKGYSGTAIFSKYQAKQITRNLSVNTPLLDNENRDANTEGRVIAAEFEHFFVVNVYTPNAKDDLSRIPLRFTLWDPLFLEHLKKLEQKKPVIVCGDFNVAHEEIDLARPKENRGKKGFTKEERDRFTDFIQSGFKDTFRELHPKEGGHYTWWSHFGASRARNIGWRIDYTLVSGSFLKNIHEAFILPQIFGSDHCPVGIIFSV